MEDIGSTLRGMFLLMVNISSQDISIRLECTPEKLKRRRRFTKILGASAACGKGGAHLSLDFLRALSEGGSLPWVPALSAHGHYGDSGSCTSPISDQGAGSDPLPSNLKDEGFACKHLHSPLSIPSFQAVTPHYLMTRRANGWFLRIQESAAVDALQTSCGPAR